MRAHAEAIGNGLEILLLLVNAVLGAPPPGLMDERTVRGIHKADDAVIDADRHLCLEVSEFIFVAELFDLRRGVTRFFGLGETCSGRDGIRDVDPYEIVALLAWVTAGVDAVNLESLIGSKRRDRLTLSVVHVELPAVVKALEAFTVKLATVQRHATMGTGIAQSKSMSLTIAADDERDFEQSRLMELVAVNAVGRQGTIPETCQHQGIGGLSLGKIEFEHEKFAC